MKIGMENSAPHGVCSLTITASPMSVRQGLAHLFNAPPLRHLSDDRRGTVEIVMAEALNNIVEHAYPQSVGEIDISVGEEGGDITCCIVDAGLPMPELVLPAGKMRELHLGDLPEGGFGWALIHMLARDLHYMRDHGRNHLHFRLAKTGEAA